MNITLRADLGQWQFTSAKFCCPPNARDTKRESPEARSGYHITYPRGIWGWLAYEDRDRTRAIEPREIPQDVNAERKCTSISRMHLTRTYNSLYLSLNSFLFKTFSCFKFNPVSHAFISFFSRCTTLEYSDISFYLFTNLIIYIEIWQLYQEKTLNRGTLYRGFTVYWVVISSHRQKIARRRKNITKTIQVWGSSRKSWKWKVSFHHTNCTKHSRSKIEWQFPRRDTLMEFVDGDAHDLSFQVKRGQGHLYCAACRLVIDELRLWAS